MAHAFDTGLSGAQRTLIRSGAVTLLSGLLRANGGYLQAVEPYGGIIRGFADNPETVDQLWEKLSGRAPSILIALGDCALEAAGIGGFNFKGSLELIAYHFSNHARSYLNRHAPDVVSAASDTADPGLDVMMEHARQLLVGQRAGAGSNATIKQVVPVREEEIRTEAAFTLWAQRYSVTVAVTIDPHRGLTQLLEEFRSKVRTSDAVMDPPAAPVTDTQTLVDV